MDFDNAQQIKSDSALFDAQWSATQDRKRPV